MLFWYTKFILTKKPGILFENRRVSVVSPATKPVEQVSYAAAQRRQRLLVFCCTFLGAAAQALMKSGANQLAHPSLLGLVTNLPLMAGYTLYGVSTLLLVLALRDGELSLLYPIIALTYVWVTALSFVIFRDHVSVFKLIGVAAIVAGVAVLGKGSKA
jgi:multidrug transporter EmrE-like cation transporter